MPSASTGERSQTDASAARHLALRDKGAKKLTLCLKRVPWTLIQAGTVQSEARNPDFCLSAASFSTRVIDSKFRFLKKKKKLLSGLNIHIWPTGHSFETCDFIAGSGAWTGLWLCHQVLSGILVTPKDAHGSGKSPHHGPLSPFWNLLWDSHSGPKHRRLEVVPVLFLPSTVGKG